ncbi:MAG: cell division protein FtsB [Gammaproteobacteria bacterium]|nr:cell division protein FtsB [Gammaproteobacteria bacterium]
MFKRVILVAMSIMLVLSLQRLFFARDGLRSVWQLREQIESQQQTNKSMSQRNAELEAEVQDLKEGLAAVEELARSELGMIKQGEIFYQVTQ